ncbi:NADP-dependent oxidoreductase [Mycolicibacterium sp. P1-18]|uniref:NADP-dependent oxidoreductase n=1 Tax=Mycolicibacterium sp. P1-18 TaxID=2024615 RepID=UPI0011F30A1C|nr:NADP-dependent oxidoreductase [Mycolicibacterium sp. P1-18]KAA0094194.1 NADP-dependent oxidoreductase [Mycolicibacterium sp. P1-18]
MNALRAHRRGGPEVLVNERASIPAPGPGEVLVEVHAGAITFDELTWDETWLRNETDGSPVIPSHEVSGVVAATADGVTQFEVGDQVFGLIRFDRDGAAAEYVTAPAADLALRPTSVSHVVAAALPLAGLTAWQALVDHARVQPGQRVLVHGGAGGVGALTVQLATHLGADVTTTVRSDEARDFAATLGASHVVDTRIEPFDAPDACYDVVVDTVGGDTLDRSFEIVCPGGRLITLSAPPPPGKADAFEIDATFFVVEPDQVALARLAQYVDDGTLHVAIAATYPLADGRAAFESGRKPSRRPGKTVLNVRT